MGLTISGLWDKLFGKKNMRILMGKLQPEPIVCIEVLHYMYDSYSVCVCVCTCVCVCLQLD